MCIFHGPYLMSIDGQLSLKRTHMNRVKYSLLPNLSARLHFKNFPKILGSHRPERAQQQPGILESSDRAVQQQQYFISSTERVATDGQGWRRGTRPDHTFAGLDNMRCYSVGLADPYRTAAQGQKGNLPPPLSRCVEPRRAVIVGRREQTVDERGNFIQDR